MLAKPAAAVMVNVSREAIGNNCYTSLLANFLDVFQSIVSVFWTCILQYLQYEPFSLCKSYDIFAYLLWISGLIDLVMWKTCLHHGGVWLHHVQLSLATFLTSLRRVNQVRSSTVFSLYVRVIFSCVWDTAITKPDLLGSDLLFFTSPTYQPPASVAVKRNGWYFRGELLFPIIATICFILTCELVRKTHCWARIWRSQVSPKFQISLLLRFSTRSRFFLSTIWIVSWFR